MNPSPPPPPPTSSPSLFRFTLGFLLVGLAWGLTTPFIRRAAINLPSQPEAAPGKNWLQAKISNGLRTALNLLRTPAYSIPLIINLTGSIWFFLLVGKAGRLGCVHCSQRLRCRAALNLLKGEEGSTLTRLTLE